jgi:hypothetical protein
MRCYTACCDGLPACTINTHTIQEARRVLTALIGDSDMTVRLASASEADAWRATARSADREKMRRRLKKNRGAVNAPKLADAAD